MDFPPEIRMMIFERLPRTITHVHLNISLPQRPEVKRSFTFVLHSVPMAILRTCRLIHHEARDVVSKLAEDFVLKATPRMLCALDIYCNALEMIDGLFRGLEVMDMSWYTSLLVDMSLLASLVLSTYFQ